MRHVTRWKAAMGKTPDKKSAAAKKRKVADKIVIDEGNGLVFENETELYSHFLTEIEFLEKEFFSLRDNKDIPELKFRTYEGNLSQLLEDPDEVWEDSQSMKDHEFFIYMRNMTPANQGDGEENTTPLYHVAVCYLAEDTPSFVYLHFPTQDAQLVERYRRGVLVYDRSQAHIPVGALDGDALSESDELASGLYQAMMSLRNEKDFPEERFSEFMNFREETLEEADEIWRSSDTQGNVLVSFIKEFHDIEGAGVEEFHYIVITLEDAASNSHALLFSFPTTDISLVERYRHGENLQAEEVVQEASH